jgi:hypothetical protein
MKIKLITTIVLATVFFAKLASAQTAYPLTCVFDGKQTVGVNPHPSALNKITIGYSFTPGNRAATAGVDPGTCAWQDRGMRAGEPTTVMAVVPAGWTYTSFTPATGGANVFVSTPSSGLWVPQAFFYGYRVTFNVYRSEPSDGLAVPYLRIAN